LSFTLVFAVCHVWAASSEWKVNPNGQVRLIAAYDRLQSHGKLMMGLQFKTAPGWYVYWKVPGDSGYPPSVQWKGSEGFKNPRILWPAPTKFILPGHITEYGYEGDVVYPIEAELDATGTEVQVKAVLSYLTCNTACVPYKYTLSLNLPVGSEKSDPETKAIINRFVALVPPAQKTVEQIQRNAPVVVKNLLPLTAEPAAPASLTLAALLSLAFFRRSFAKRHALCPARPVDQALGVG